MDPLISQRYTGMDEWKNEQSSYAALAHFQALINSNGGLGVPMHVDLETYPPETMDVIINNSSTFIK